MRCDNTLDGRLLVILNHAHCQGHRDEASKAKREQAATSLRQRPLCVCDPIVVFCMYVVVYLAVSHYPHAQASRVM